MSDFKNIAHAILEKALHRKVGQAEVYIVNSRTTKIDVLNQKIESSDIIHETGLSLRLITDQKLGFSYSSEWDETAIDEIVDRAISSATSSAPDEFNQLPQPAGDQTINDNLQIFDPAIDETPLQKKIGIALAVESAAYGAEAQVKKTEKVSYSDSQSEIWLVNSFGIDINYKANYCGAHADVIAVKDEAMESGFGFDYQLKIKDLNPEKIGREAALQATQLLGAKTIGSQNIPLVLDPLVGSQLLEVLAQALSSEAAQKGRSLFADKVNSMVGAQPLNIVDNGKLPGGLASAPYDAEGIPSRETRLVENGQLKNFLFNYYTAQRGKTRSTGNASRPSFKAPPSIGHTNLYIQAGGTPAEAIIQSTSKGIYITRVMGLHTANPISGDFSIGAAGIMIENGEKTFPVRGITIAGNLIDLLKNIAVIGSDLRFFLGAGTPTLLINNLTISGN